MLSLRAWTFLPEVIAEMKSCCDNSSSVLPEAGAKRRAWLRRSWDGGERHWSLFLPHTAKGFHYNTFCGSASQLCGEMK